MKPVYKYLVAGVVLFSSVSCEDKLELSPFNAVEASRALQTQADFTNAMRGAYTGLFTNRDGNATSSYYGGWMFSVPDILSDNVIISSEGRLSKQTFHFWNYDANSTWEGLWSFGYMTAGRANAILENIDNLPEGEFKTNIMGEALALRAMAHFDIARVFAESPAVATGNELGIPYITSTDARQKPSRPPLSETYTNIISDLTQASELINATNPVGRMNKAAVNALLTRVYLFMGDYQKTIDAATAAINSGGDVASIDEFPKIWKDETNKGLIFHVPILDVDRTSIGVEYSQTGRTGVRSEYVVDYELYQLYEDTDVRKDAYISTSVFASKPYNHVAKYFGRASGNANVVDLKILRWAEVYLSRAEAYAMLGQDAEALADLNMIRENRYTDFEGGEETGQELMDAIALERRLELAFEGDRFFTLKRKNMPVDRSGLGEQATGTGVTLPADALLLPADSYKFVLPIPQDEINANENMQQNPGYVTQ